MDLKETLENQIEGRVVHNRCDSCEETVPEGGTIYFNVVYTKVSGREKPGKSIYAASWEILRNNFGWCADCYDEIPPDITGEKSWLCECTLSKNTLYPVIIEAKIVE
jgi:hypothetical protein